MKKFIFILFIFCMNLFGESRIVTLTPSINEIVYALGMGNSVVANTKYCDFPEESKEVKKVGGYATISLEKIIETKPTVVIAQNYDEKLLRNLKSLDIKTLVFKTDTIDSIKNTIKTLGKYFHKENKANEIILNINNSLASLKGIISNKKVLIVIGPRKNLNNQIYITGNNLYFEDILKASGNKNAFFSTSKNQPVVNSEKIINMNPDIIVLLSPFLDGKIEEQKELMSNWLELPVNAAIKKNIYIVDKLYSGIPSQRVVYFIKDFKKILENVRNK
ncbi:ABC transporter substrate-binding protein [Poseidonibacter ostreae]|uniref:ABC transporter substrate-binding protein n=1 Tax=Poseidonibacter ostreae TaxID=2654171 RepID=A0A6L4WVL6_9BACT|nr:helical backbone metal receptor [Poseidonibacter ostreae]KAB7887301.1 ABC transporter substrate-binding protein [Poseidonibacter ostreae]KAB7890854.1 ABC transporter substrate-binding protein [Poseidonibacter ostreae]